MILQVGDLFDHYQIQAHVAQGGQSDIYSAHDLLTGRDVALKIPNETMIGDPAQFERFRRELQVMQTLQHPAIQRGLGSGQFNRTPYLVTEWVEGTPLRALLQTKGPLPPETALDLVRKVAEALAYCHDHGVIDRDLKPENILITPTGQPVILDFGLALTLDARRVTYANLSAVAGTPDYMAPEQIEGQRGDKRTDVYALGTILYELLAGKPPFGGDNNLAVMAQHLQGTLPRLDRERPGISPQLAAIATRCLQRNPDDRFLDMHALVDALDHPETVDLTILDKLAGPRAGTRFWRSQAFAAIVISLLVMAAIIVIAMVAQKLRGAA